MSETFLEVAVIILMSLGAGIGFGVLLVHAIMKGFTAYMNWKPRGR